jgi:hypothetical protein
MLGGPEAIAPKQSLPRDISCLAHDTDSCTTDAHLAGDGRMGKLASLQQSTGFKAAFFKLRMGKLSWSPYHGGIVNQLRRTSIVPLAPWALWRSETPSRRPLAWALRPATTLPRVSTVSWSWPNR